MESDEFTTEPVKAGNGAQAEWLSVSDVAKYFSISKGLIYQLLDEGAFKSVVLRRKGQTKGKRLIHTDSIRQFFDKLAEEQKTTTNTNQNQ